MHFFWNEINNEWYDLTMLKLMLETQKNRKHYKNKIKICIILQMTWVGFDQIMGNNKFFHYHFFSNYSISVEGYNCFLPTDLLFVLPSWLFKYYTNNIYLFCNTSNLGKKNISFPLSLLHLVYLMK